MSVFRRQKSPLLLVAAVIGVTFTGGYLGTAHAQKTAAAKWEHLCEESSSAKNNSGPDALNADLNKRGEEGWELVSTAIIPRGVSYKVMSCYKRPKA